MRLQSITCITVRGRDRDRGLSMLTSSELRRSHMVELGRKCPEMKETSSTHLTAVRSGQKRASHHSASSTDQSPTMNARNGGFFFTLVLMELRRRSQFIPGELLKPSGCRPRAETTAGNNDVGAHDQVAVPRRLEGCVLFLFTSCRRFKFGDTDASFYVETFCA